MNTLVRARLRSAALGACLVLLGGCHKAPPAGGAPEAERKEAAADKEAGGVALSAEQVQKMGIATSAAQAASNTPEAAGYAMVMAHEALAQGVADLITAQAVEQQSRAALVRIEHLAGTPGALPADAQEAATRQAAVDQASLALARQRLSALFGQHPPWKDTDRAPLESVASGEIKLVRVTFPLGELEGGPPASVRLAHLNASRAGNKSWKATTLWEAPADANVPGRSFFALLKGTDAGEGERLLAWTPIGAPEAGVLIPASAAIISNNKYWCYLERKPGVFTRVEIDTRQPLADGYFMSKGIGVGDKIVTEAAGLLLARELNPGTAN